MNHLITGSLIFLSTVSPVFAVANFDRLTQCADIQKVWADLRTGDPNFAQKCGHPSGPIERAIASRAGHSSSLDLCFLDKPPAAFLSGFQCVYTWNGPNSAGVVCIRQIAKSDITDYFHHHDDLYAKDVSTYLSRASACIHGHGDAATAPRTLASPVIGALAKYDFGFALTLRSGSESAVAQQGYASLDPSVIGSDSGAIEFISLFIGPLPDTDHLEKLPVQIAGNWSFTVDPADDMRQEMEREFKRQAHIRVILGVKAFSITRSSGSYEEDSEKLQHLAAWEDVLAKALMHHDFEPMSNEDMKRAHAPTVPEYVERLKNGLPYAFRGNGPVKISNKVIVLINTWSPGCTKRDGGFSAIVMAFEPQPLVKEDNGTVVLMTQGFLSCASENLRSYIDEVLRSAEVDLKNVLEGR